MTHSCESCVHFHAFNGVDGECRHKAPCWSGFVDKPKGRWPMVGALDWCGDFEAKKEATEQAWLA
jgi:hypothetical protein